MNFRACSEFRVLTLLVCIAAGVLCHGWDLGKFIGRHASHDKYAVMMKDWVEFARTNRTVETEVSFLNDKILPFLLKEMPDPFVEGGSEFCKPWAKEGHDVYMQALRTVAGAKAWGIDDALCRRARGLVEKGTRDPLLRILAALDPEQGRYWNNKRPVAELSEVEKELGGKPQQGFLRFLLTYAKTVVRADPKDKKYRGAVLAFRKWMQERPDAAGNERVVQHVGASYFGVIYPEIYKGVDGFGWSCQMAEAHKEMSASVTRAGNGPGRSLPASSFEILADGRARCESMLKLAEAWEPGRPETIAALIYVTGVSRRATAGELDELFLKLSRRKLDDHDGLHQYLWYRLYPRWHGDRGYREMLAFADACLRTERHDTMLPFLFAEMQCRYVYDAELDPFAYFKKNVECSHRAIDVCMRQATNVCAHGYARMNAPFVGAAISYYAGRYEMVPEFTRHMNCQYKFDPYSLGRVFADAGRLTDAFDALSGTNAAVCVRWRRMYDEGRFRELVDEMANAPQDVFTEQSSRGFATTLRLNARMKADFPLGKYVHGRVKPYFPGWWNAGWWRSGDNSFDTYGGFDWQSTLTWRAELPKDHELHFTLVPKPKTKGPHILVVSRYVDQDDFVRKLNGLPFIRFTWEEGRTGIVFEKDYRKMFSSDFSNAKWVAADGPERKIRIKCKGGKTSVFIGDAETPVLSNVSRGAWLNAPAVGYARFRGADVRIWRLFTRRPWE